MPSRHSKHRETSANFNNYERDLVGSGTQSLIIGADSQLPFGFCPFSLSPITEGVISPSGHLYSREAIIEYLLTKTREIKETQAQFEAQEARKAREQELNSQLQHEKSIESFVESQDGVSSILKRKRPEIAKETETERIRKKLIDDRGVEEKREEMSRVCPWVADFTPNAAPTEVKEPPKRPSSPFSGRPMRAKDLMPIELIKESTDPKDTTNNKYICPVSRKTITNQKLIFIKSTGAYMLESIAKELAYPTMTCPVTGKTFRMSDVIPIVQATSSFASTGNIVVSKYTPKIVC